MCYLLRRASAEATRTIASLTRFINDALRQALRMSVGPAAIEPFRAVIVTGTLVPDIDYSDPAGLLAISEADERHADG